MNPSVTNGADNDLGFTIAEVVIAAGVVFLMASALLSLVVASHTMAIRAQEREHLVNFTASYMEWIRGLRYVEVGTGPREDPPGSVTATSTVVGAYAMQIAPTITWVDDPAIPGTRDYKRVSLVATACVSASGGNVMTYELESIVASIGVR